MEIDGLEYNGNSLKIEKEAVSLVHALMNVTVATVTLISPTEGVVPSLRPLENEEGDVPTESFSQSLHQRRE